MLDLVADEPAAQRAIASAVPLPWKGPRLIALLLALYSLAGIAFALWLADVPAGRPDPRLWYNVFYVLFARNEPLGLAVVALFSFGMLLVLSRRSPLADDDSAASENTSAPLFWLAVAAIAVFVTAAAGTYLVCHNFALTADENMSDFQARIFLHGKFSAEIPAQWQSTWRVFRPTFADYLPSTQSWKSAYLPGYAAMRAAFQIVGLQSLLNPFLAAITIVALYGTARNIWPDSNRTAVAAVALLASSSQFLVMAMTSYSMPAHLALNTVWLWCYSRPDRRRFYLAPFIGIFAIGLHQPIVHALFAAPFLLRLVWQRRWRAGAVYAVIYAIGCAFWFWWRAHFQGPQAVGADAILRLFNYRMLVIQPMDLLLLIGWASLATPLFAAIGFAKLFRLPPLLQDAAASCILTFVFYYFFFIDQGHGWGYRYFHGALSCLVLIAVAGWLSISETIGSGRAKQLLVAGVTLSVLVQLPLRCWQAESFIRPYAKTSALFKSSDADIVAFDARHAWYSADLVRNDPFLTNRPLIVALHQVTPEMVATLQQAGKIQFIDRETLAAQGLATELFSDFEHDPFDLGRGR